MTLEHTLEELAERRAAFAAHRAKVDEELRRKRVELLAAEQAAIEGIVVRAMAEGATLGQVKKAYNTKDHRTIATIVAARAHEIDAVRKQKDEVKAKDDWFVFSDIDTVRIWHEGSLADFSWTDIEGELMFTTSEPRWNDDFTVENKAVALLDGKTESESAEARHLAKQIRKRG